MAIYDYFIYFYLFSFVGWFFESCYCSLRPKKWINRGFLRGPFCPIYGVGALIDDEEAINKIYHLKINTSIEKIKY